MRIKISHETTFRYEPATRGVIQNLRLTPRSFDSQYVLRWRVSVDLDGALRHTEDSLGNVVQAFSHAKPVERFVVAAHGEVETLDAVGVVRGAVETLPTEMYLRSSEKAHANASLRDFAHTAITGSTDPLDRLHKLMDAIHGEIAFDPAATPAASGAGEALALKKGAAADFAHVFIAAARLLGIPARFVSGYVVPDSGETATGMSAWAEATAPGLGWIAFDAARNMCADANYVRVAIGFDAASAAPFRASHMGAAVETVGTVVQITDTLAPSRGQSQRQS